MTRWYVVALHGGLEETALKHCEQQGFQLYIPMRLETEIVERSGKIVEHRRPRFRGYGFVALDLDADDWAPLNNTRGIRHLVPKWRERPLPLPVGFIERLRAEPEKTEEIVVEFAVDELVRLIAGPFAGYEATVERQDGSELEVRFEFGGTLRVASGIVEKT